MNRFAAGCTAAFVRLITDESTLLTRELQRIVPRLRAAWADVRIVIRGDSGFCREPIMRWCEEHGVDYIQGLAKNKRLGRILGKELHEVKEQFARTGQAARCCKDFTCRTIGETPTRAVLSPCTSRVLGAGVHDSTHIACCRTESEWRERCLRFMSSVVGQASLRCFLRISARVGEMQSQTRSLWPNHN